MGRRSIPLATRLATYALRSSNPDGCWLWTGAIRRDYGVLKVRGRMIGAHRVAYQVANGPIPPGMLICHRCDNPLCVNPAHLFLGTPADNMHDMMKKGRQRWVPPPPTRGPAHPQARLSTEQVNEVRRLYAAGGIGQRGLAQKFGVSQPTIGHIVRNERRLT